MRRTNIALVIRAVGLAAIVVGVFLLSRWFMADVFPFIQGRKPHNSFGFRIFRDSGAALTASGIVCRFVARRMLVQRITANEKMA
jgi:hypothetical protein